MIPLCLTFYRSTYTSRRGKDLGWKPQYPPEHMLEAMDAEVDLILSNLDDKYMGIR